MRSHTTILYSTISAFIEAAQYMSPSAPPTQDFYLTFFALYTDTKVQTSLEICFAFIGMTSSSLM